MLYRLTICLCHPRLSDVPLVRCRDYVETICGVCTPGERLRHGALCLRRAGALLHGQVGADLSASNVIRALANLSLRASLSFWSERKPKKLLERLESMQKH